jgi:hypothetical protein
LLYSLDLKNPYHFILEFSFRYRCHDFAKKARDLSIAIANLTITWRDGGGQKPDLGYDRKDYSTSPMTTVIKRDRPRRRDPLIY